MQDYQTDKGFSLFPVLVLKVHYECTFQLKSDLPYLHWCAGYYCDYRMNKFSLFTGRFIMMGRSTHPHLLTQTPPNSHPRYKALCDK